MRFRKLRIAFSAVCGIICLLLIALWVRSYTVRDMAQCHLGSKSLNMTSLRGQLALVVYRWDGNPLPWSLKSTSDDQHMVEVFPMMAVRMPRSLLGIRFASGAALTVVILPKWLPVLLFATFAAVPWLRWSRRFSLRTLLIATSLFGLLLGLVVYASR